MITRPYLSAVLAASLLIASQASASLRLHAVLQQAMQRDHNVRLVYRDWPIFGEASARAARLAIASQFQHK